jgi:hypothetical protein
MSKNLRCCVGDLAVIVDAFNKCNVGKIVRVVEPYSFDKATWLTGLNDHNDWIVTCPSPLVWTNDDGRRWRRKRGPVPDFALQPIKGIPAQDQQETERPVTEQRARQSEGKEPRRAKPKVLAPMAQ